MVSNKHDENFYNCTCPICGKKFHLKPFAVKRFKNHYCSKVCHNEAKKEYMKGEKNHQYGLRGSKNASYGVDTKINPLGYRINRCIGHPFGDKRGFVLEHRLVAEKFLLSDENSIEINGKKYLSPEYVAHHKNLDRTDNRPENLEIMSKNEHSKLHTKLNPQPKDESTGKFIKRTHDNTLNAKRLTETAIFPTKATDGSAGFDLYVDSDVPIEIPPHETKLLQTNIAFEIPDGFYGAIYARSGLATLRGLRPSTCVSIIDSDYRGSVGLPLYNDSSEPQIIQPYERVAQMIIQKAVPFKIVIVDSLPETDRGSNGFGSTGRR